MRVTSVYERLKGQWRLVHRHSDPITTPRPADSVWAGSTEPVQLAAGTKGALLNQGSVSGQWRAMRDGSDGIPGSDGNVVSVSYRIQTT